MSLACRRVGGGTLKQLEGVESPNPRFAVALRVLLHCINNNIIILPAAAVAEVCPRGRTKQTGHDLARRPRRMPSLAACAEVGRTAAAAKLPASLGRDQFDRRVLRVRSRQRFFFLFITVSLSSRVPSCCRAIRSARTAAARPTGPPTPGATAVPCYRSAYTTDPN